MTARPTNESVFEDYFRLVKASKLALVLVSLGQRGTDLLDLLGEDGWATLAERAQVEFPSTDTQKLVASLISDARTVLGLN